MKLQLALIFLLLLASCREAPKTGFREVNPSRSGVHFGNFLEESPELNILTYLYYYNGAGIAVADFNNDSLPDLYFVGNQQADAFYLNRGQMRFEEVSGHAGIGNSQGWTTGVTHVDINGDGLLDLYLCKAAGYRGLEGRNLLYVNQGLSPDGVPTFREAAEEYGLDFSGLSTQAAFFDYDLDGDLDLFLLNHSVHPNRNYGKGSQRKSVDPLSGDRLYRNDRGRFTDVSREAGIFQGKAGYGLGVGISDLDQNGYPDLYVGNDFFENDYLYLNQGDGTFREIISTGDGRVGHTTHFSMGNDLADINNDGLPDIVSLDMLPEDLLTYKTSGLEYAYPIYRQYLQNGFAPQFMQNTLQVNLGGASFAEVAHLSGVAATEWSWGALLADLDNDGYKDLFVTNGIKGATNDMDYMNFIANEAIQRRIDQGMQDADMPLTREIPPKKVANYLFKNNGDLTFSDQTASWIGKRPTFSNGAVYADLDRDGDLDLVVSHVDEKASILENTLNTGSHLSISFEGTAPNTQGIGARVMAYSRLGLQVAENFPSRGYLSAVAPEVHFGLGTAERIDSLLVVWPGGAFEIRRNVAASTKITLRQADAGGDYYSTAHPPREPVWSVTDTVLPFVHRENTSLDFDREPLVPFAASNEGPALSVADVNRDGLHDLFISGAKRQASALYLQHADGTFREAGVSVFAPDALAEDTGHVFVDVDRDGWEDLLVVSGGNEFYTGEPLRPRLYRNRQGTFQRDTTAFSGVFLHASRVDTLDWDRDGDTDVFISANNTPGAFGKTPEHGLFANDGNGNFTEVTREFLPAPGQAGGIRDFKWADLDGDGREEFITAGHWAPVRVYSHTGDGWAPQQDNGLGDTQGWWNCLELADVDGDGDLDLITGNWGLNSKFHASPKNPITLYRSDFDGNGTEEPLVTHYQQGVETPFASKDELVKQMPFLNKRYRTYREFAQASLDDLFGPAPLKAADQKKVYELASCVFLNDGKGNFSKVPLPLMAQASVVYDILVEDQDGDGYPDLLLVGNLHEISTQLGRMDALHGVFLKNRGKGSFEWIPELSPKIPGASRAIDTLRIQGKKTYVIGRNNASPLFITKDER
jgi:hypothetical protein